LDAIAASSAQALFDAAAAARGLGIDLVSLAPGRARVAMTVGAGMINGHGICHGGYVFLLADTAFALACNGEGRASVAGGAEVSFVSPAHLGEILVAEASEVAVYGRSGITDVAVRSDEGRIVALVRGRSREVPAASREKGA
jgi:acyl-CoA thioesterase